jgi:hypothetical protein
MHRLQRLNQLINSNSVTIASGYYVEELWSIKKQLNPLNEYRFYH